MLEIAVVNPPRLVYLRSVATLVSRATPPGEGTFSARTEKIPLLRGVPIPTCRERRGVSTPGVGQHDEILTTLPP